MAVKERVIVSVATAKAEAAELVALAYLPQPVPQPDGTSMQLCWWGRLHRGMLMASDALIAGDSNRVALLESALKKIEAQAVESKSKAEQAIQKYNAVCGLMGETAENLYPPDCTCDGCRLSAQNHRMMAAMGNARDALYRLVMPGADSQELPLVISLIKTADQLASRDRMWAILKQLADNLEEFADASKKLGQPAPKWEDIWP